MTVLNERLAGLSPEKRALLMQQLARQGAAKQAGIGRRQRPDRIAPSFAQQRLWILDQLSPGSAVYNVPTSQWLQGTLEVPVLQRALDEIVRRHESLRTVIACDDVGAHQLVQAPTPVPITRLDLRHLPAEDGESAAITAARDDVVRPFDITQGPLFRALLVQVADERFLLTLNAHHIAVDGWSLGIVADELRQLYAAFQAGRESPLAELPVQYVDYALWQHEQLETEPLRKQLTYWQEQLSGRLPVLELPGDRPRPAVQSYRGEVSRSLLQLADYDNLKRLCRQEGVTPFMAVLAAFNTLLLRYSGQSDQIVGVGVANRNREELEPLVGFFVNTLALRTDLTGNPTFRELLARVKEATLGAYSHQDLPIERLMDTLDLDRSLSHSPLFQAMLFFQNFPSGDAHLAGLTLTPIDFDRINQGTARADLSLFASESDDGLWLFLEYATDLFDEATIVAFSRHLRQLLRSVAADPSRRIGELAILDDDERRRLLSDWNDTRRDTAIDRPLHALFEAQVARSPDAVAIEYAGTRLTYAELDAQADALARTLAVHGAGPGELVGLFVERTPRMLVALLGVLKAGAAYVPLDPGYPADRLAFMLEDSGARLVVTERDLLAQLPASTARTVLIEDVLGDCAAGPCARVESNVGPEDLAYVIFTSGSTGRPKGVQIPHRAAVNFLTSMAREPGLSATDALCAVTTLSFDIALLELLLPLTVGARIVLADRATAGDGAALSALIECSGSTAMQATPATWRMLLDAGWQGANLRVLCGGEALPRELADRLLRCTAEVWNLYGPTETTVWSTVERITVDSESISIGRPLANTEVYVVDGNLQPVPVGVPGELLIGGLGVARGYLSRPDLTAEKFIHDPFGVRPDARLYRTGDLARWRRDGKLEVVGRIDHQVKLRGFRIELGEIESVLDQHAAVQQAVVTCREDRPGDKRLVAYVVAHEGSAPTNAELRAFARERLPEYMVPGTCVMLDQLPMTPNGKVDRRALPAPESDAGQADTFVAPRTAEEEVLVGLWAEVLGRECVGIHDDFFDLGGHSLLATQLMTRVKKAFGDEVGLRMLFEAPTVAAFAERLLQQRMDGIDTDALAGMLDQLEGLSNEQIQALLAETGS